MATKWIAGAIKKPGAFTAQAEKAGEGVEEYARTVLKPGSKASPTTKKRAVLAETLSKMHHPKKKITKLVPKVR